MITRALSAIGQIEVRVKKFWAKIGDNLPHPSITDLGYVMSNSEVIHGDAYERLLEVLGIEDSFNEIMKLPIMIGRDNYLKKYLHKFHSDNRKQFIYSLALFTLFIENVALFSQFYTIQYFNRYRGMLKHTNKQTEYTSREESLHAMIGIRFINQIRHEFPELFDAELEERIISEAKKSIEYECNIIDWIVNGYESENLNSAVLREFIKNRMNDSLNEIGYPKVFEIDQTLLEKTSWFDEQLLANSMTDFFDSRPIEYTKSAQSFMESDIFDD